MAIHEEDRALVSIINSHAADVLPFFRLPYYLDLFPARRTAAEWLREYFFKTGEIPRASVVKRTHKDIQTLQTPEPLKATMDELRQECARTMLSTYAKKCNGQFTAGDLAAYAETAGEMVGKLLGIQAPIEAAFLDPADYNAQVEADYAKNSTTAFRVIPTGMPPIDKELGGGLRPGLYTLSALISLGKTYVTIAIAEHMRKCGFRVLYVGLEMTKEALALRSLCVRYKLHADHHIKHDQPDSSKQAGVSRDDFIKSLIQDRKKLLAADSYTGAIKYIGADAGAITPKLIQGYIEEMKADCVIIDAAQDLRDSTGSKERTGGLYNALQELNGLVGKYRIPILMTVQLQAEVEQKGLQKGNLTRIAWGQVFAQKSEVVMTMLGDRSNGHREVKFEKTRDGQPGKPFVIEMAFPYIEITASHLTATGIDLDQPETFDTLTALDQALDEQDAPASSQTTGKPSTPSEPSPDTDDASDDQETAPAAPLTEYERKQIVKSAKRTTTRLKKFRKQ